MCAYCDKSKNDDGYWENAYEYSRIFPDKKISHGVCPECFQKYFPDEYEFLCKERRIVVKEKTLPNNTVIYGCIFY